MIAVPVAHVRLNVDSIGTHCHVLLCLRPRLALLQHCEPQTTRDSAMPSGKTAQDEDRGTVPSALNSLGVSGPLWASLAPVPSP